jgi:uncharacterized protein YqkB
LVEYGKSLLSLEKLILLCKATGKSPDFFLQDEMEIEYNENSELLNIIKDFTDEQLELLSVSLEAISKYKNLKD